MHLSYWKSSSKSSSFKELMEYILELIQVRARLHVLLANDGGRSVSVHSGYRPDHNFGDDKNRVMYMGAIDFAGEPINPGETREVEVRFLSRTGLSELLRPGKKWRVQEGSFLVGTAEVLEVKQ